MDLAIIGAAKCPGISNGDASHLGSRWFAHEKGPPERAFVGGATGRDQRCATGLTSRLVAPVYSWRGRPILYSGEPIISLSCAIQPTVRASAKMPVNSLTGTPIARCTMPE